MAFPLTLAMGCSLTLGGRKERHSKPGGENFMDCAMATGFCSKRTLGFRHPPFSSLPPFLSLFFSDSFIIASASIRVHAPRHDYWPSWRIHRGISSDQMRNCLSFSLSLCVCFRFVLCPSLLSIKTILPSYLMRIWNLATATNPFIDRLNRSCLRFSTHVNFITRRKLRTWNRKPLTKNIRIIGTCSSSFRRFREKLIRDF